MTKRLAVLAAAVALCVISLAAQASPILILISFEGWRWDYIDRAGNAMFNRTIGPDRFTMASATARDPRWWGGEQHDDDR